ncbi:MAG: Ni/Fe-hydrogenase cytochrome b subunit [Bryobacteraceae bacterium]|nr:Ni/Fe-hydrogenase cytochrome b subunit [Bryobacterales bacterium]MEB2361697.1 Ni/Fe-hydrogenase cytochrome b subunit [Bryobacterales bacterium]NUN03307.1 Ni/Fe-hydrogenase cytochrome b subunit [Bryobacteraceae bacterium]
MTGTVRLPRITFWRTVFWFIMAAAVYATYVRFVDGLGSSTNLSDEFPWGIWIGFDVLCGVALAAGGFTLAATVHIFNIEKYKPIVRPAILTAFLGYLLVVVALMFDLGRPYRIWHPLIMWNPHSVMFEVGWCVTLYSTVLSLEFAPVVFERFGWRTPLRYVKAIMIPLVIAGVILSTLHQSSLGTLYLILPTKLHALWYSPMLPVMFFVSAIALGLAMTIFESWHSSRAFGRHLELPLLSSLGRVLAVLMLFYLCLRFLDLGKRGVLNLLTVGSIETYLFGLEIALLLTPTFLLFWPRVRQSPLALYLSAVMVVLGMIVNRLNVSITGMERGSGVSYIPAWTEVAVTLGIIAAGFAIFRLAVQHLPIFEEEEKDEPVSAPVYQMAGALGD